MPLRQNLCGSTTAYVVQPPLMWFNRHFMLIHDRLHTVFKFGSGCSITLVDVQDLGVVLDNILCMKNQIASITKSCFFHLRCCLYMLVQALVISRLDYCNSVL